MALTDIQIKNSKPKNKTYRLWDEKGMYVEIPPKGKPRYRFKYQFKGKEKRCSLGTHPERSLKKAREDRDAFRKLLADGIDPSAQRKALKQSAADSVANCFEAMGREWHAQQVHRWTADHADKVLRGLEKNLFLLLGKRPIAEITPPELLSVLRPIEQRGKLETAQRTKQYAGQIFRYAIATGRAERDPSADLKGALKTPIAKHFAAITDPKRVAFLMRAIYAYNETPIVTAALKLSALIFCRPGELRHLEWSEVNWDERRIEIPAHKMKKREPHIIPLSSQALAILKELQLLTWQGKYVFPSARGMSRPMSENAVRTALRTMGFDNETMTAHGFRAMARTILDEVLNFPVEWIEHQLAHTVKDHNGTSYNRTKHLPQRREMLQKWADWLSSQLFNVGACEHG